MGVAGDRLHGGKRRNSYLDAAAWGNLDKGSQAGLHRRLRSESIHGLPREVSGTHSRDLVGDHVS